MKKKASVLGRGLSSILNDPSNNSLKISEKSNPNYSKISLKKIAAALATFKLLTPFVEFCLGIVSF